MDLNPKDGQGFVTVRTDNILIYSRILEEHLSHLRAVMSRLIQCLFVHEEVSYLGHAIMTKGLQVSD